MGRSGTVDRDGTIDNSVVAHEWGHYLHQRLVACGSNVCAGESEGWADFNALMMAVRAGDELEDRLEKILVGSYYIWLIFMRSYLARLASETPPEPKIIFAITAALGFAALGLRIAAWAKKRRKSAPAAA